MTNLPMVLVVEDDEDDQFMLELISNETSQAVEIVFASNGQKAIDILQTAKQVPCFILTDLNMPVMDGFELMDQIRAHEKWVHIPVVMYSTTNFAATIEKAYARGFTDFISKPSDIKDLENIWQRLCQKWVA